MKDTFLPMSIKEDSVVIYEPYGSAISKGLECEKLSGSAKYICLCMKNIQDKKAFLQDIVLSIKDMQNDMINKALNQRTISYL